LLDPGRGGPEVAIVEREHFGGTCVNNGCTPTGGGASAYAARVARRHALRHHHRRPIGVDMKASRRARNAIVAPSRNGVERSLRASKDARSIKGTGVSCRRTKCRSARPLLSAPQIFINVGGSRDRAAHAGLDQCDISPMPA